VTFSQTHLVTLAPTEEKKDILLESNSKMLHGTFGLAAG
jgi:hypothetical protein